MLCAISGESPQVPVISIKSGNVFEKRLIEDYIRENGTDPVSGEEITTDDLVELKTARIVAPKPPTFTSIPSLLSVFQKEWDALALESYSVRQQLQQTRQELSTALYQHDAAIRVIARLTEERDQARDALSKVTVTAGGASNGDAMQVDAPGLSEDMLGKIDETQARLSKSRRKRPVPKQWATVDAIESYKVTAASKAPHTGAASIALDPSGTTALVGSTDGVSTLFSLEDKEVKEELNVGAPITDAIWVSETVSIISTKNGNVKIFDGPSETVSFASHAGSVNSIALHPSNDLVASVGTDKSFVFYDIPAKEVALQVYVDSSLTVAAFHPDGHIFGAGAKDGMVKMYHVKTGELATSFDLGGPVRSLSFSENGIWFAAATEGSTTVAIFDIRKEGEAAEVKVIDTGSKVDSIAWDYTGQFLATAGPSGVTVQHYQKSSKSWSEPLRNAVAATAVAWGEEAKSLVTVSEDGVISVLSAE